MRIGKELAVAKQAAFLAGKDLINFSTCSALTPREKKDDSPITDADIASSEKILRILHNSFPDYGILSEENIEEFNDTALADSIYKNMAEWNTRDYTWIIDPLDGTRNFIEGSSEFGIHIGLTYKGEPIFGVNYYPMFDTYFYARKGCGAYKQKNFQHTSKIDVSENSDIRTARFLESKLSKDLNLETYLKSNNFVNIGRMGSAGLKAVTVAQGDADVYAVLKKTTSLWDTCSSQVIVEEAGGQFTDINGERIDYRKKDPKNYEGFLISNGKLHEPVLETFKTIELLDEYSHKLN